MHEAVSVAMECSKGYPAQVQWFEGSMHHASFMSTAMSLGGLCGACYSERKSTENEARSSDVVSKLVSYQNRILGVDVG